ncbi:IspD/TarI family cytidylyltransferase [Microbacterium sp. Mu-80]|uniref:IspD/TarI family cytidylyltransferase n=1 Tax=Microbacterium bandirmense TaxID=3122050 RepID=A0ABU8LF84_9MICO
MNIGVIFAGGTGSRMGVTSVPKQFLDYGGKPLIIHTLEHFERHPDIDALTVAIPQDWEDRFREMIVTFGISKVRWIVAGGTSGQDSIYRALRVAHDEIQDEDVKALVHDGVRPLINDRIISENLDALESARGAITVFPAVETVVVSADGDRVDDILPRSELFIAQAPQTFWLHELVAAHESAREKAHDDYIDSCSLMRGELDVSASFVIGTRANIKVTTPEDYFMSRALLDLEHFHDVEGI